MVDLGQKGGRKFTFLFFTLSHKKSQYFHIDFLQNINLFLIYFQHSDVQLHSN